MFEKQVIEHLWDQPFRSNMSKHIVVLHRLSREGHLYFIRHCGKEITI